MSLGLTGSFYQLPSQDNFKHTVFESSRHNYLGNGVKMKSKFSSLSCCSFYDLNFMRNNSWQNIIIYSVDSALVQLRPKGNTHMFLFNKNYVNPILSWIIKPYDFLFNWQHKIIALQALTAIISLEVVITQYLWKYYLKLSHPEIWW